MSASAPGTIEAFSAYLRFRDNIVPPPSISQNPHRDAIDHRPRNGAQRADQVALSNAVMRPLLAGNSTSTPACDRPERTNCASERKESSVTPLQWHESLRSRCEDCGPRSRKPRRPHESDRDSWLASMSATAEPFSPRSPRAAVASPEAGYPTARSALGKRRERKALCRHSTDNYHASAGAV